ncbi:MAG: hypothetical protein QOF51_4265 [Chloroflexota bacterium]|jgi:putative FmdB family regulatory protein|nr:hypothetical protein [Chloroflexota bacterium]
MPIYEYRCNSCGRRVQLFFRSFSAVQSGACAHCGSTDLARAPSRVAIVRSESTRQELLADPSSFGNVDYNNPRAIADWAKQMGEAAGVDAGEDYAEMIDAMEQGGLDEELGGGSDFGGFDDGAL